MSKSAFVLIVSCAAAAVAGMLIAAAMGAVGWVAVIGTAAVAALVVFLIRPTARR